MSKEPLKDLMQAIKNADENWPCAKHGDKEGLVSECSLVCNVSFCPKKNHLKPIIVAAKIHEMSIADE